MEKALIWRIVHRDNLPWILVNGMHCRNSPTHDPGYVNIGNVELIDRRASRVVPIPPGGTLSDYVPFYFTPFSVMMMNIKSGRSVKKRANEEIVILVSSLRHVESLGLSFVFTDAHAYTSLTGYYNDLARLDQIDWDMLQRRDFKRDPDDPRKLERYQAEALIHSCLPVNGILGVVCYDEALRDSIGDQVKSLGLSLPVHARKEWYFE